MVVPFILGEVGGSVLVVPGVWAVILGSGLDFSRWWLSQNGRLAEVRAVGRNVTALITIEASDVRVNGSVVPIVEIATVPAIVPPEWV